MSGVHWAQHRRSPLVITGLLITGRRVTAISTTTSPYLRPDNDASRIARRPRDEMRGERARASGVARQSMPPKDKTPVSDAPSGGIRQTPARGVSEPVGERSYLMTRAFNKQFANKSVRESVDAKTSTRHPERRDLIASEPSAGRQERPGVQVEQTEEERVDHVNRTCKRGSLDRCAAPYIFSLMLRNVATFGFMIADHNEPGNPGGYTAPGCVLASPSWPSYPGNVAGIIEDYVFNWTRDAAITMSAVLSQAPAQISVAGASDLLASYVTFASTCQASGDIGQAHYTPEGASTGSADESDGPALRILTILQGFAGLDGPTQTVARNVIAADLSYLLDNDRFRNPTFNLWEDTFGQSIFARSVQLAALNQVINLGPGLGIAVPPTAQAAATWLGQQLPLHWSGAPDNYYVGVLDASRGGGDPPAPYDPSIDPILSCIYGAGIPPYDPRLLSTAAQVRAQWTEPAPAAYPINAADAGIGIGPCIGRYNGDEYNGDSLTSNTGHPWVVCTCGFAQLYYELAAAINKGTPVPTDPLAATFLSQIGVSLTSTAGDAVAKLQAAGDKMLQAVLYHSNRYELSEQFDQSSGYEISVSNLTWSYAAFLSAVAAR
jgi:glucoamylase